MTREVDIERLHERAAARGTGQTHAFTQILLDAGLTFTPAEQGVKVEADISGEQLGDSIASAKRQRVLFER